ncbi:MULTISPECIES: NifB/NifX family molybdenum-iron cluster-binding protein [unclassified Sulfurospirillum]|uniref:NifB/NifX family molybdenum-iron cluster-binding protein n=1 Tax=unclassified Sulfurospirillum TaxID=2618290 RepID=UPI000541CD2A|nr:MULTISPECIES: NifB/NifX family molybdenum-iron cluster-binding protein [unclassified Sulfurospirillum]MCD8543911.1 dinitrogenase iron-molybdenum cofactor biosynthesis protein [Sulfurospirillum cavolei]KHG33507.1 MAG: dinitrogenase iron-molybdenum cofactor biosynthesis protein [Sulfurospirillum sp. MES]MCP3651450.1 NifB/NifX family molybdenum-iron cluster-binding protein [Sulfurospirillum sp. DNRA8]MCR1810297.1 NifB/NifX family molybdenum-iron cluster-binding protein [Sulfurospirillum sp. DNR
MKIAFASTDNLHVNDHFGWCKCFYMYELHNDSFSFLKTLPSPNEHSEEGDKLAYKIACLEDANILCASHIGPRASLLVKGSGIFVLKSEKENEPIEDVLNTLLRLKNTQPPLWMQRFLHAPSAS